MSSGDTIFPLEPRGSMPTDIQYATLDTVVDAAAAGPKSITSVLRFAGAVRRYAEWAVQVPSHYGGGGFTWTYKGGGDGSATGVIQMDLSMTLVAAGTALDSDLNANGSPVSAVDDAQSSTPNALSYSSDGVLSHANAGSPIEKSYLIIRLSRDGIADSNTDDMLIAKLFIKET